MSPVATESAPPVIRYQPQRATLPPLGPYWKEMWRRRGFASQLALSNLRAQHYDTVLGQLWMILNPVLLAGVYFVLISVILQGQKGGIEFLGVLLCGLFAFYYTRNAVSGGATSVVGGGNLVMNSAFPRALLPLSSLVSALIAYLPMLGVYAIFHLAAGFSVGPQLLWLPLLLLIQTGFNLGLGMVFAAATVYFRDTASLLPYFVRMWLYLSPVLYTIDQIPAKVEPFLMANPLYAILGAWQVVVSEGQAPDASLVGLGAVWAVLALALGAGLFLTREREFALRI